MKDGKFLPGCKPQNVTVTLILREHLPKTRPKNSTTATGSVTMYDLQDGNTIAMTATNLQE